MKTGFVTFQAKNEKTAQQLEDTLLKMKSLSNKESGLVTYEVFQSEENALTYYVRESWVDQAAFEIHLAQPHIQHFLAEAPEWLMEPIVSIALKTLS